MKKLLGLLAIAPLALAACGGGSDGGGNPSTRGNIIARRLANAEQNSISTLLNKNSGTRSAVTAKSKIDELMDVTGGLGSFSYTTGSVKTDKGTNLEELKSSVNAFIAREAAINTNGINRVPNTNALNMTFTAYSANINRGGVVTTGTLYKTGEAKYKDGLNEYEASATVLVGNDFVASSVSYEAENESGTLTTTNDILPSDVDLSKWTTEGYELSSEIIATSIWTGDDFSNADVNDLSWVFKENNGHTDHLKIMQDEVEIELERSAITEATGSSEDEYEIESETLIYLDKDGEGISINNLEEEKEENDWDTVEKFSSTLKNIGGANINITGKLDGITKKFTYNHDGTDIVLSYKENSNDTTTFTEPGGKTFTVATDDEEDFIIYVTDHYAA